MASMEPINGSTNHVTNGTAADNSKPKPTLAKNGTAESPDPTNPLHFPRFATHTGIFFNGVEVMRYPVKDDPLTHLQKIQDLTLRCDDVIITAYPKCGTHWVAEILHMLMTGKTEFSGLTKEYNMLEFVNDMSFLDALPSPRVLNSHLYTAHLPQQIVEKKVKMIHLIRNPKDVAVSMYHHLKQAASDQFTFANFLKGYYSGKHLLYSHQFVYLRQMAEFEKAHPDQPIMHIHYEDLKQDSATVAKQLAQFVGVSATDEFCQTVSSACGFSNMKKADEKRDIPEHLRMHVKGKLDLYRKGIVGDWKNHFTVAQSEIFDEFLAEQEQIGFGYSPKGL